LGTSDGTQCSCDLARSQQILMRKAGLRRNEPPSEPPTRARQKRRICRHSVSELLCSRGSLASGENPLSVWKAAGFYAAACTVQENIQRPGLLGGVGAIRTPDAHALAKSRKCGRYLRPSSRNAPLEKTGRPSITSSEPRRAGAGAASATASLGFWTRDGCGLR
jgi:hypothetical protein